MPGERYICLTESSLDQHCVKYGYTAYEGVSLESGDQQVSQILCDGNQWILRNTREIAIAMGADAILYIKKLK